MEMEMLVMVEHAGTVPSLPVGDGDVAREGDLIVVVE